MSTPEEEAYARQWPEHAKMLTYTHQAGIIAPFLEWLEEAHMQIGMEVDEGRQDEYNDWNWVPISISTAELLARYFGYDLEKIKIEQGAMRAQARQGGPDAP